MLAQLGIDVGDALHLALRRLRSAGQTSAAWQLMEGGWSEAQTRSYLGNTVFGQPAWVEGRLRFSQHPFRGPFIASYWFKDCQHLWQRFHNDDLEGKTLAVVGLGSIGTEVAKLAQRLNFKVIGSKHQIEGFAPEDLGVTELYPHTAFKETLPKADFVCLIYPHTPETEGMMDETAFAAMKPGSVLINIGRGALVQEDALLEALKHGPVQGAVLDVAPQEPLPETHPLWDMENVILFPHSASTSRQENRRLTDLFCANLRCYLNNEPLQNVFVYDRLY